VRSQGYYVYVVQRWIAERSLYGTLMIDTYDCEVKEKRLVGNIEGQAPMILSRRPNPVMGARECLGCY